MIESRLIRFLFAFRSPTGELLTSQTYDTERSSDWGWDYAVCSAEARQYADSIDAIPSMIDWEYLTDTPRIARVDDESRIPAASI